MSGRVIPFSSTGRVAQWLEENHEDLEAVMVVGLSKSTKNACSVWSEIEPQLQCFLLRALQVDVDQCLFMGEEAEG
jgi:hypothetical protein